MFKVLNMGNGIFYRRKPFYPLNKWIFRMYYLPKQISFKHKIIKIVILNRFSLNAGTVKGKSEKNIIFVVGQL